ncbi:MAG TPA: MCE family protein [Aeromicrobium sp.]|nr:MCE family protein [Aeromicrobium sp.]
MTNFLQSISRTRLLIAGGVILTLLVAWLLPSGANERTVTAHFPQAVSIYKGSDVTIMGVPVGRVTEVVPQGDSVKVVMHYSGDYKLPADVKAAIVTPTLVADRFVQLVPAYSTGPVLPDDGDIPLERSVVPVEMDRIYRSISTITETLGPAGANKKGALGKVLASTADSLDGNGELGHEALENLAAAARSFGDNSPELFATVESLAGITETLAKNDEDMTAFLKDLSRVSKQLGGESDELEKALEAIAKAVIVTQDFVHDNRKQLATDLSQVSHLFEVILREKESLKTTLELGPLGLTNLVLQFDKTSSGAGIRVQLTPALSDLGNVLCSFVITAGIPNPETACTLFKALAPALTPVDGNVPVNQLPSSPAAAPSTSAPAATPQPLAVGKVPIGENALVDQINQLLAGAK